MPSNPVTPPTTAGSKTVAAIDVGANALRMAVAQVFPGGQIDVLERLQQAVRLGQDTFRRGRLGAASMNAAVTILREYRRLLETYRVEQVRSVATSAVREATNADTFLDRVLMATGLKLEVIATSEESRLTVSAVLQALSGAESPELPIDEQETLIADVGGGSTLLTVLHRGQIANSLSLRLGSIRLQEMLATNEEPPERSAELLRHHIASALSSLQGSLPLHSIGAFMALGGDARFAARELGKPTGSADLTSVARRDFHRLVRRCQRHTTEELARHHGLPFAEAETLNPALLVYQALLRHTRAREMFVSEISMRDGLLLELARGVTGQQDESLVKGVIHSATALAGKYRVNLRHARVVAGLAVRLFDELQPEHGLGPRFRLLLQVAGLLHEVGRFVSGQAHHKHSYYLINNAEIFGLNRHEIAIAAHVARYHRRSAPKASHVEYMSLPRESRVVVVKLAALLRVADAMARGQIRHVRELRLERQADELVVYVSGVPELILEERTVAAKGDLFEEIFGMRLRLERI
jgi:exopolyphosphatase/guanosine-5'-triphosphate,3'-diphosphate pyrophosphatase